MMVRFLSRAFAALADSLQPRVTWTVENFSWHATGGPRAASLVAEGPEPQVWQLVEFLGQPFYIYDDQGTAEWWGLPAGLDFTGGGVEVGLDLNDLANSVAVAYTVPGDGSPTANERATTAYSTDATSTALYGTKQVLLSEQNMTAAEAESRRAVYLAQFKKPHPRWRHAGAPGAIRARLTGLGLYDTLAWKYYDASISGDIYAPDALLVSDKNRLGDAAANAKVAQSFQVTIGAAFYVPTVRIYLQKVFDVAYPTDSVQVSIQADAAGAPSGVALDSGTLAVASIDPKLQWHEFSLTGNVAYSAATTYWIVAERTPAPVPGGNGYYFVGTDEEAGYSSGACSVYNSGTATWAARSTAADMPFQVVPTWDSITAITDIAGTTECGQFLSGTTHAVTAASSLLAPPYRDGDRTGLDLITGMLAAGVSGGRQLLAWVTEQRILHLEQEDAQPSEAELRIGRDGVIRTRYGQGGLTPRQVVRRWARVEAAERLERFPDYIYADGQQIIRAATWSRDGQTRVTVEQGDFTRPQVG